MSPVPLNPLIDAAFDIPKIAVAISAYLQDHSHSVADHEGLVSSPPETVEYSDLIAALNDATQKLLQLVNGPKRTLTNMTLSHYDLAAYQVALEFGFFDAIPPHPPETTVSLSELAAHVGLDEDRTARVMRMLVSQYIFEERTEGFFSHSPVSELIASDEGVHAAALMQ